MPTRRSLNSLVCAAFSFDADGPRQSLVKVGKSKNPSSAVNVLALAASSAADSLLPSGAVFTVLKVSMSLCVRSAAESARAGAAIDSTTISDENGSARFHMDPPCETGGAASQQPSCHRWVRLL